VVSWTAELRRRQITTRNREEEGFGAGDDDAKSIGTIFPHELESVEEEDDDQIEKQEVVGGGRGEEDG